MLIFLFLAFVAAFAIFHIGKYRLNTPLLFNLLGSFCIWASVFCIGGAFASSSGPWSGDGDEGGVIPMAFSGSLKYLAVAALTYGFAHFFKRVLYKRPEHNGND